VVVEHLSLKELYEGDMEGGLPCRVPWKIGRKGSGDGLLFPQGPHFCGTWGDAPFLRPLREGKIFFIYAHFYEEFEKYIKKKPRKRAALSIGALLGNLEEVRLLGLLREKGSISGFTFSWNQRTLKVKSASHLEL
jgi:hypothetical protein